MESSPPPPCSDVAGDAPVISKASHTTGSDEDANKEVADVTLLLASAAISNSNKDQVPVVARAGDAADISKAVNTTGSAEGCSSPDVNKTISESCRDINKEFVLTGSPLPRNMTAHIPDYGNDVSEGDATSTPDATPVWSDTPSQLVDGTEVVTQDYMVSQQLRDEELRQAKRRKEHESKLLRYERKKLKRPAKDCADVVASDEHTTDADKPPETEAAVASDEHTTDADKAPETEAAVASGEQPTDADKPPETEAGQKKRRTAVKKVKQSRGGACIVNRGSPTDDVPVLSPHRSPRIVRSRTDAVPVPSPRRSPRIVSMSTEEQGNSRGGVAGKRVRMQDCEARGAKASNVVSAQPANKKTKKAQGAATDGKKMQR